MDESSLATALKAVLEDESFKRSPSMAALLSYLVAEELAGRGDRLSGFKVGVEALRKPDTFDPSTDASVRVETGRLRRMLKAYAAARSGNGPALTIPKGSYRPRLEVRPEPVSPITVATSPSSGPAIAVLPSEALDDDAETQRFGLALRQELLTELVQYREFHFADVSGVDLTADVARRCSSEFECEFMLGIQVSSSASKFRAHLTATDLELDRVVWSERIDLERADFDLLDVSENLAATIADQLARPTGIISTAAATKRLGTPPPHWSATDCIIRWHLYRLRDRSKAAHAALKTQVQRALRQDPGFSLGYAMYAQLNLDDVIYLMDDSAEPAATFQRASHLVDQAVSIDPRSGIARYVKAQTHYFLQEYDAFLAEIETALELQPRSTDMLHQCGTFLCFYGNWDLGRELLEKSGMRYHAGAGYRLAYLVADYFQGEDMDGVKRLFETMYVPADLAIAHLIGALIHARCDDLDTAAALLKRAYGSASGLRRGAGDLARLWFADEKLRKRSADDLERIERHSAAAGKLARG